MEDQRLKVKDLGIASMEAGAGAEKLQRFSHRICTKGD